MTSKNYTANILGELREVRGWNKEGNLVLADGNEYVFKELKEQGFDFRSRKLLAALTDGSDAV
ncbi:MAG: hypothetical protein AAB676_14510 [Verrucomicrobiota bacterium]